MIRKFTTSVASSWQQGRNNLGNVFHGGIFGQRGGPHTGRNSAKNEGANYEDAIEIVGSPDYSINGLYEKTDFDVNGMPHYQCKYHSGESQNRKPLHLYWTGVQWAIHHDISPTSHHDQLLAYSKIRSKDPKLTSGTWFVRCNKIPSTGSSFEIAPNLEILVPFTSISSITESSHVKEKPSNDDILGIPRRLAALYIAFMFDAIAVGLAMPLLPFFILELGANAFQLSLVVSANYVVQMIGCLVMGTF